MKHHGAPNPSPPVNLSREELLLINNALNEILNGPEAIEDWEFETRVGCPRSQALALLKRIGLVLTRGGE